VVVRNVRQGIEDTTWRRRLFPNNRWALVLTVVAWTAVFAHRGGKEARKEPPSPVATGRDPWIHALLTGRPTDR
jgi:hypothetical protein